MWLFFTTNYILIEISSSLSRFIPIHGKRGGGGEGVASQDLNLTLCSHYTGTKSHPVDYKHLSNRPYSRCPPSLHALKDWWDKSDVTWFSGDKQVTNSSNQCKESQSSLFILDNRKWTTFYTKVMGGSDHCYFFNVVATADVLTASNNDVNFVETQTIHFAWLLIVVSFWENKQTRLRFLALANFIFCLPPQIPREIAFILSPKARAKMAVLVKSN